jgi:hypothetical protein
MKSTCSLVVLALLDNNKSNAHKLNQNSAVNLKINGVVYADDFDTMGDDLSQVGSKVVGILDD